MLELLSAALRLDGSRLFSVVSFIETSLLLFVNLLLLRDAVVFVFDGVDAARLRRDLDNRLLILGRMREVCSAGGQASSAVEGLVCVCFRRWIERWLMQC